MEKLRPNNNNGDAIALGCIALALAVLVTTIRLGEDWSSVVNLIYTAIAAAFVLGLAYLAPVAGRPAWYETAIYVAGFGIAVLAVFNLADVLGADGPDAPGTRVWILVILIAIAGAIAWLRNSGVMTLFSGLLAVGLVLSLVEWIFTPDKPLETYRWLLAVIVFVYIAIALLEIVPEKFRQVAIVDAAGFALLALSFTFVSGIGETLLPGSAGTSAGWEIIIGLGSLALIGYALVDGDPGPAYLGGFNLIAFGAIVAATDDPSLVWWPLILVIIAGAAFAAAYTGQRVPKLSEAKSIRK